MNKKQLTAEEAARKAFPNLKDDGVSAKLATASVRFAFIKGWYAHAEQDRWIPVTERVPDDNRWVRVKMHVLPHWCNSPNTWLCYGLPSPVHYVIEWKDF